MVTNDGKVREAARTVKGAVTSRGRTFGGKLNESRGLVTVSGWIGSNNKIVVGRGGSWFSRVNFFRVTSKPSCQERNGRLKSKPGRKERRLGKKDRVELQKIKLGQDVSGR